MRTYTRADLDAARTAWDDGHYGSEWAEVRRIMAAGGTIYPPSGDRYDERDDPEPSQRVIVWRALDYRLASTLDLARHSRSWPELVGRILLDENRLREDATLRSRDDDWARRDDVTHGEAVETLAGILRKLGDSVGVSR
ncbi:MAG TPA: hypothetical protein VK821_09775 [Dehalococcoidia bacterium]|nr:hypothetical protein [Dehalococcoidia bacterium]